MTTEEFYELDEEKMFDTLFKIRDKYNLYVLSKKHLFTLVRKFKDDKFRPRSLKAFILSYAKKEKERQETNGKIIDRIFYARRSNWIGTHKEEVESEYLEMEELAKQNHKDYEYEPYWRRNKRYSDYYQKCLNEGKEPYNIDRWEELSKNGRLH